MGRGLETRTNAVVGGFHELTLRAVTEDYFSLGIKVSFLALQENRDLRETVGV